MSLTPHFLKKIRRNPKTHSDSPTTSFVPDNSGNFKNTDMNSDVSYFRQFDRDLKQVENDD